MDSAKDFGLAHTDGHARKPRIKLIEHIALLGTPLGNDGALGPTIDEGLHWVPIDLGVDVEHSDVAEELGVVLHRGFVVRLNHLLSNFVFDHLLGFNVVRVRIP